LPADDGDDDDDDNDDDAPGSKHVAIVYNKRILIQ
jgi:hypothetical protein